MVELNPSAAPAPSAAAIDAVQPPEQLRYALWLDWGTRLGALVLVFSFGAYLTGWLPPRMSVLELSALWHLPASEFTQRTGMPQGWAWLAHLDQGDMPSLLALVPLYLHAGDRAYAAICLAEVAVLALAASGILSVGH
jgi:hypothetical protein